MAHREENDKEVIRSENEMKGLREWSGSLSCFRSNSI